MNATAHWTAIKETRPRIGAGQDVFDDVSVILCGESGLRHVWAVEIGKPFRTAARLHSVEESADGVRAIVNVQVNVGVENNVSSVLGRRDNRDAVATSAVKGVHRI